MKSVTIDAAGFFIQLFPCIFMIYLPFPQQYCRLKRSSLFACLAVGTALLGFVFAWIMTGSLGKHTDIAANVTSMLAVLMTVGIYSYLIYESIIKKLLVFFVVLFYGALQYCLVNLLKGLIFGAAPLSDGREVYSVQGVILYAVTAAVMLPPMIMFLTRVLREYICRIDTHSMLREFVILIISTIVFLGVMVCVDITYYHFEYSVYLILLVMFLVLLFYQVLIYRLMFRESLRQKTESEQIRTMELQQMQYEKIIGDMENTKRMHHDLQHHLNMLDHMLENGNTDGVKKYLSDMITAASKRENKIYCGNMTVNGLLQYYTGIASGENIKCTVQAECSEVDIEPPDMTILLGNAMENAINACKNYDKEPWIDIRIGEVGNSLAIEITNSCKDVHTDRRFDTEDGFLPAEAFISRRREGGCGLKSISHTAEKYNGSARFAFDGEENSFTSRIRLDINKERL